MATKLNIFFFIAIVAATLHSSAAQRTHLVGDALNWVVPPSGSIAYTTWASRQTFNVGDILIFNYTTGRHDVAEVTTAAFDACNLTSPISLSTDGPTNITLNSVGAHYYICTFGRHCELGQKLAINVSAASATPAAPPPAATTPEAAPVPAPTPSPFPVPTSPSPISIPPSPAPSPSTSRAPRTYFVGDASGWIVPTADPIAYQNWASNNTFIVGDILVFNFTVGAHDVAEVTTREAYESCNVSSTRNSITTSPARIPLTTPGEQLFMCTFPRHCSLGQKLAINVAGTAATTPSSGPSVPPSSSGGLAPSGTPATTSPDGNFSAPPPPSSAPSLPVAALSVTFLSIALAFLYQI